MTYFSLIRIHRIKRSVVRLEKSSLFNLADTHPIVYYFDLKAMFV